MLMDLNNSFKCRMGGESLAKVQFIPNSRFCGHHQMYEEDSENPGLAGNIRPCERKSGRVAGGFKSAAG